MLRFFQLSLLLLLLCLSGISYADTLTATRQQPLREISHRVAVSVKDGVATYRVQRTFHNGGKQAEEALLRIDLPHGAVATGLRIYAAGKWHEGDLMHSSKAEELYQRLTGLGPSRPKDPALLFWNWTNELGLRVFPIFPGSSSLVEYTLTLPTQYEGGLYTVSYPRRHKDSKLATPVITLTSGQLVTVDAEAHRGNTVRLEPATWHPLVKELGFEDKRMLVRELTVARESDLGAMAVDVHVEHTWIGDVGLQIVDPQGELYSLRLEHESGNENNLNERFVVKHDGKKKGKWHLLVYDVHPLDGGMLRSWSLTPVKAETDPKAEPEKAPAGLQVSDRAAVAIPQPNPSQGNVASLGIKVGAGKVSQLRYGRVEIPGVPFFARVEVDVAAQLSEIPRNHRVVFLIDQSHTMGEKGIDAQVRLAEAYLSHVPHAQFALLGVSRYAKDLVGFKSARAWPQVIARLRKEALLAPQNGSFLDRGFEKANALLRGSRGSTAIVAFTDNDLRREWKNETALSAISGLAPTTVVHVVDLEKGGDLELRRDDEHNLFPLAAERLGVLVHSRGVLDAKYSLLKKEARYLVRPDRLDHIKFTALEGELSEYGDTLREGESVRWMDRQQGLPATVALKGQLWSKEVVLQNEAKEEFHRATAGFVFSLDYYSGLTDLEQYAIATYAGAVSPVTSYLAIEPGVRPSTIGLEARSVFGMGGSGMSGFGIGGGGLQIEAPMINWALATLGIESACATHRSGAEPFDLTVEYHNHEIAEIQALTPLNAFGRCVIEKLWKVQLPPKPYGYDIAGLSF